MNKLACWQINLHHCRAANINLAVEVGNLGCFAILIQEPWVFRNGVGGLPTEWRVHRDTFSDAPRACIATSPCLQGLLLSQFTSRDSTAILIESGHRIEPNIVLAFFYMSHDSPIPPPLLGELITFCQIEGLGLVIGCDANAHHTSWGSSDRNQRGNDLADFLVSNQITWYNVGNIPTFQVVNRSEVLDMTLINNKMTDRIDR